MTISTRDQAIQSIQAGQLKSARAMLEQYLRGNPGDVEAWLWLLKTLPDNVTRLKYLEACRKYNPDNEAVRRAYAQLKTRLAEELLLSGAQLHPAQPAPVPPPNAQADAAPGGPAMDPPTVVQVMPASEPAAGRAAPAAGRKSSNALPWVAGGFVFLVVLGMVMSFVFTGVQRADATRRARFTPFMPVYLADYPSRSAEDGKLTGKLIWVDLVGKEIDQLNELLPPEMEAREPEEVGGVVRINRWTEKKGIYVDDPDDVQPGVLYPNAARWHYTVQIVNLPQGVFLAEREFLGADPPDVINPKDVEMKDWSGFSITGDPPSDDEIIDWVVKTAGQFGLRE